MSFSPTQDLAALASINSREFRKRLHDLVTISESRELEIDPDLLHTLDTTDKRVLVGAHTRILFKQVLSLRKIAAALSTERHKINHVKIQRKVDEILPQEYAFPSQTTSSPCEAQSPAGSARKCWTTGSITL